MTEQQHYYYGTGRRKGAIARVRLYATPGNITINGKPVEEAFPGPSWVSAVHAPLRATGSGDSVTVVARAHGGGVSGQADAVALGIARALLVMDPDLRTPLRAAGLLTRDSRVKESKKYGLKRARKAPQYTKR